MTPEMLTQLAQEVGEKTILSRAGGAPTLAVGMAQILLAAVGGTALMAFWYHFAILFEALFILTDDRRRHPRRALHDSGSGRHLRARFPAVPNRWRPI